MPVFEKRSTMPVPVDELYAWHARPGAFERLTPPWQRLRVVERSGGIADGDRLVFEYGLGPVKRRWVAVHRDHVEGVGFTDVQEAGPFARWEHRHRFAAGGDDSSVLEDHVEYELPGPPAGDAPGGGHRSSPGRPAVRLPSPADARRPAAPCRGYRERPPLRVAITGGSGFVGGALTAFLDGGRPRRRAPDATSRPGRGLGPLGPVHRD